MEMKRIVCQTELLLFCLQKSEQNEEELKEEIQLLRKEKKKTSIKNITEIQKEWCNKEKEWLHQADEYEEKIAATEKILYAKTDQLVVHIRKDSK